MEDANTPLALHPSESFEVVEHCPTQAVLPAHHPEPTHQQVSTPHSDLAALLVDIPSTVYIENL
jgi:hypothetical protein